MKEALYQEIENTAARILQDTMEAANSSNELAHAAVRILLEGESRSQNVRMLNDLTALKDALTDALGLVEKLSAELETKYYED